MRQHRRTDGLQIARILQSVLDVYALQFRIGLHDGPNAIDQGILLVQGKVLLKCAFERLDEILEISCFRDGRVQQEPRVAVVLNQQRLENCGLIREVLIQGTDDEIRSLGNFRHRDGISSPFDD